MNIFKYTRIHVDVHAHVGVHISHEETKSGTRTFHDV